MIFHPLRMLERAQSWAIMPEFGVMTMTYTVRLAAGCFDRTADRHVSDHSTANAAINAVRKSNRLEALNSEGNVIAYWTAGATGITRDGRTSGDGAGMFVRNA